MVNQDDLVEALQSGEIWVSWGSLPPSLAASAVELHCVCFFLHGRDSSLNCLSIPDCVCFVLSTFVFPKKVEK